MLASQQAGAGAKMSESAAGRSPSGPNGSGYDPEVARVRMLYSEVPERFESHQASAPVAHLATQHGDAVDGKLLIMSST